jgi:hypothetical protein
MNKRTETGKYLSNPGEALLGYVAAKRSGLEQAHCELRRDQTMTGRVSHLALMRLSEPRK